MKKNVGGIDRVIRIVLGVVLLSLIFIGPKTLWGLVGLIPLLTGIFGYCGLYSLFGKTTCKPDQK